MTYRILVTGSRTWTSEQAIRDCTRRAHAAGIEIVEVTA